MGLILVVSEDLVEIETIKASLSVHGWWITVAAEGQTAVQVAADQAPKLVVVDAELPEALDLIRSFGTGNGGPSVLTCVPPGYEQTLELKEAGTDEVLTKPVTPAGILEAVQRCLSTPPSEPEERPAPASLLTTEQIFGDVLREIEVGDEHVVTNSGAEATGSSEPIATVEPTGAPEPTAGAEPALDGPEAYPPAASTEPALDAREAQSPVASARPEPDTVEAPFEPEPPAEPASGGLVSLAGLFDSDDESGAESPPDAASSWMRDDDPPNVETSPSRTTAASSDHGGEPGVPETVAEREEWRGDERRSSDRPWTGAPAAATEERAGDRAEDAELLFTDAIDFADVLGDESEASAEPDQVDEPAGEAPPADAGDARRTRVPRSALAIGAIAAMLLVGVGALLFLDRGTEPAAAQPGVESVLEEPVDLAAEKPVEAADPLVADPAPPADAPGAETGPPAAPAAEEEPEEIEEINLEAIVDQELERREEELRRVFLEEEQRLLRELDTLAPEEPADDEGEDGTKERAGVGR